jgi:hypothetical protein
MRRRPWIGVAVLVGATLAGVPAWADGGAYLDLDRTHYLPGQTARFEGYVSIPRAKQDLIEHGPFYVFVAPPRTSVIEGRPIPTAAVRAGTASIERDRGSVFELHGSFVVPELAGRSYGLSVCNDPCTISGFREPLTGTISIVATAREGELLTEVSRLNGRNWSLRRQVRKGERANLEIRALLTDAEIARSALASRSASWSRSGSRCHQRQRRVRCCPPGRPCSSASGCWGWRSHSPSGAGGASSPASPTTSQPPSSSHRLLGTSRSERADASGSLRRWIDRPRSCWPSGC